MRYREIINEVDHQPAWTKRTLRNVITVNASAQEDEWFKNFIGSNDAMIILGLLGNPKLKKLQTDLWWIADTMSSTEIDLDSRVQHVGDKVTIPNASGMFSPNTGKIAGLKADLEDYYQRYYDNDTLLHEALHRAFAIIRATPAIWAACPQELKANWSQGVGAYDKQKIYKNELQANPEHSIIYSVTQPRGKYTAKINQYLYDNYSWVRKHFDSLAPEFNDRYVDLTTDEQPIIGLKNQMLFYWQDLYRQTEQAVSQFLRSPRFTSVKPRLRGSNKQKPIPGANTFSAIDAVVQKLIAANLSTATDYGKSYAQLRPVMQDHFENLGFSPVDPRVQKFTETVTDYVTSLTDPQLGSAYRKKLNNLLDIIKNHPTRDQM